MNSRLLDYPTLLPMPAPRVLAYPMSAIVAEKLEAIVSLGMVNSRMKDFYDIWFLSRTFPFQAEAVGAALRAIFERRKTGLDPDDLKVLLAELSGDVTKQTQWRAFLGKSHLAAPDDFAFINDAIREFLLSPAGAASAECQASGSWPPSGPWQNRDEPSPQSKEAQSKVGSKRTVVALLKQDSENSATVKRHYVRGARIRRCLFADSEANRRVKYFFAPPATDEAGMSMIQHAWAVAKP